MFRNRRPSASLLVAIFAMVVATTGSAVAVIQAQSGDSLIAQRTLSGNRLRLNTVTGKEVANLQWHNLALLNGWENYNGNLRPPAWAVDAQGIVHLRGAVAQPSGANNVFARLPLAVRPATYVYVVTNMNIAAAGRIYIAPTGYLHAEATVDQSSAQAFTSLDGITWAK